jgi:hypothetical protein
VNTSTINQLPIAFGYDVNCVMHGEVGVKQFHFVGREKVARRRALLKTGVRSIISVEPLTHEQWIRAYGIPGKKM